MVDVFAILGPRVLRIGARHGFLAMALSLTSLFGAWFLQTPAQAQTQTQAQPLAPKPQPIDAAEPESPAAPPPNLAQKPAEASKPAASAVVARIGYIPVIGAAQIFVADKEGYFKAAGIEPKFTAFESGPAMIQALASGSIDVYVAGVAPLAIARSKGVNVQVVAATAVDEMTVIAGAKLAAFFKPDVSQAEAFKAFRQANGKPARLATQPPGSVPHTTLMHWLMEVVKADKADYDIVTMGIDAMQMALLANAVDGATLREPAVTITMLRAQGAKPLAFGSQMFAHQPGTVVAVTGAFTAKNPNAAQGLTDAVVKATKLLNADPEKAAGPVEAALGKGIIDKETIVMALRSPASHFVSDPAIILEPVSRMQAFQAQIGALDQPVSLDGLINRSYYMKAVER